MNRPVADVKKDMKCLMFDSWFTSYRGAIVSIALLDGVIRKGMDNLLIMA